MKSLVQLGYEVGSGDAVEIPVRHMAVTGQTQESGKTTTLEALICRSGHAAIAFLTKRGEGSFTDAVRVRPYFKERTDWKFVQSIIESVMRSDQERKQSWIMRACEGAKTLADVQARAHKLENEAKHPYVKDMYMVLAAYLDEVVPLIASLPKAGRVELQRGKLSVMDLVSYPLELQYLVISSTLDWIHEHEQGVITVIPEAWKFIPQGRNTPVRMAAENLIREGAGLKNYVWVDSQDMAGVDKVILRACAVWIVGVQREWNEVKRALSNMSAGLKKLNAGDVARLELGQFYACYGSTMKKTYVQPAWMEKEIARGVALGNVELRTAIDHAPEKLRQPAAPMSIGDALAHAWDKQNSQPDRASGLGPQASDSEGSYGESSPCTGTAGADSSAQYGPSVAAETYIGVNAGRECAEGDRQPSVEISNQEEAMPAAPDFENLFDRFTREFRSDASMSLPGGGGWNANAMLAFARKCWEAGTANRNGSSASAVPDALHQPTISPVTLQIIIDTAIETLRNSPAVMAELAVLQPEIVVRTRKQVVELDGSTIEGKVALLIADGFFSSHTSGDKAFKELKRKGAEVASITVYRQLDKFCAMGFLTKEERQGYKAVSGMKISKQAIEVQQ